MSLPLLFKLLKRVQPGLKADHKAPEVAQGLARVRALTRRGAVLMNSQLKVGNLTLCSSKHVLECAGRSIPLTPTEFALLEKLMRRAGIVVRKETLAEAGWKHQSDFSDDSLYVFMRALRAKIHSESQSVVLQTVRCGLHP